MVQGRHRAHNAVLSRPQRRRHMISWSLAGITRWSTPATSMPGSGYHRRRPDRNGTHCTTVVMTSGHEKRGRGTAVGKLSQNPFRRSEHLKIIYKFFRGLATAKFFVEDIEAPAESPALLGFSPVFRPDRNPPPPPPDQDLRDPLCIPYQISVEEIGCDR